MDSGHPIMRRLKGGSALPSVARVVSGFDSVSAGAVMTACFKGGSHLFISFFPPRLCSELRVHRIKRRADTFAEIWMNLVEQPDLPLGDGGRNATHSRGDIGVEPVFLLLVEKLEQRARLDEIVVTVAMIEPADRTL
jgi:hypothetical protein